MTDLVESQRVRDVAVEPQPTTAESLSVSGKSHSRASTSRHPVRAGEPPALLLAIAAALFLRRRSAPAVTLRRPVHHPPGDVGVVAGAALSPCGTYLKSRDTAPTRTTDRP